MKVSVTIPVCNERESIDALYTQLHRVLNALGTSHEIVADDGSTDGSDAVAYGFGMQSGDRNGGI